ncbi:DNA cytosine methyltransferase [Candidatus Poriferisodalis sp.]|uniref:DNA cytosine methyltransferase n=1 Tax=Candidatus Poriferisodalis sp. TaxID=3101277 RepID=UPI003B5AA55A
MRLESEIDLSAGAIFGSESAHVIGREAHSDPQGAWWKAVLAGVSPSASNGGRGEDASPPMASVKEPHLHSAHRDDVCSKDLGRIRTVDLFCGVGGLTAGVALAGAELGQQIRCELAADADADALAVFARNHRARRLVDESVQALVDYRVRGEGESATFVYAPELLDDDVAQCSAGVDLVVAGPPCQGHSNLNNHTRRSDRRNHLYLCAVAFALACRARAVVIENVTSVIHDRDRVVDSARTLLEAHGYGVTDGVLAADDMGWPQTRKRHFLIARMPVDGCESGPLPLADVAAALRDPHGRSVMWAIGDDQAMSGDARLHELPEISGTNRERIAWLFDNDAHDLALTERPESHRDGTTYGASYGRMHADRPSPTITTGYTTPGRGRFVHPTLPRTISHAEAARLQGFPDVYCFEPTAGNPATSAQLSKWIGNAVTIPLGYAAALSALLPTLGRPEPQH